MNRKHRRQGGFTLIEILVVLVIIGFLTTIVAVNVMDQGYKGALTKVKSDFRNYEAALDLYKLDNFSYPTSEEGLASLVPKYVKKLQKDPWGRDYLYSNPGDHGGDYDIYSLGSDGASGGEKEKQDLGNWNIQDIKAG
jgi:general secretion pathway protein G